MESHRIAGFGTIIVLLIGHAAWAHNPIYVVVDEAGSLPRLAIAVGSVPVVSAEQALNFASGGIYANQFVSDLPAYDSTLFPFGSFPGVELRVERIAFPAGFGLYAAAGSTTPVLTTDGAVQPMPAHAHLVHYATASGVYKPSFRLVDLSGQLAPSAVFTLQFRAARAGFDSDGDGVSDVVDNCIHTANADQLDGDGDSVGDVCDDCPLIPDRLQRDFDDDGAGDACNCGGDPCAPGDFDHDGDVDLNDFGHLQRCGTGPLPDRPGRLCLDADLAADAAINLSDLDVFRLCETRDRVSADPQCAD